MVMTEPLAVLRWASPPPDIQDDQPRDTAKQPRPEARGPVPGRRAGVHSHPDEEQCDLLGVN